MLFTTPTEFAALACLFVAGWLLGLASHPGGRKWKDRYAAERDAHAGVRKDGDARVSDAQRRIAELERENARLAAAPVAAPAVVERRDTVVEPTTRMGTTRRVVRTPGERRGWFDFNRTPTNG
ncbi:MAG TPA: hypothetical protein VM900_10930 [Sphingomonas sp.]|jgi:hypothetical protein|nr:hypothetical protein [Sphingomonas sp.]